MTPTRRSAPRSPSSAALRGALICYGMAGYALLELIADGATVALFALGSLRGISVTLDF